MAAEIDLIRIADIGVVPAEAPGNPVVCPLDEGAEIDVAGSGNGFVDVFDTDGHLLRRFASRGR